MPSFEPMRNGDTREEPSWTDYPPRRPMASDGEDDNDQQVGHAPWRALFYFTKRSHATVLGSALLLSVVAGIVIPATSIVLGMVFNSFAEFGGGRIGGAELMTKMSTLCMALTLLGGAGWELSGGSFSLWLAFGELQAKNVRETVFDRMMERDMEWYDLQKNGLGGLLPQVQRYVALFEETR